MALDQSTCEVVISSDRMEATLRLVGGTAPEGLSVQDLQAALTAKGVTHGIDEAVLRRIATTPQLNSIYSVAKGQASQEGQPERIEFSFAEGGGSINEDASGSIDFRSIKNFNSTRAGSLVAQKYPASEGRAGFDVLGNQFKPREGKKATLRTGKGVTLSEDGMTAVAEIDGHACLVGDRVSVLGTVDIPVNVDYSVGNINFVGNVRIRGGVMPGFSVIAEGAIEIAGNVEKAIVRCGGNLDLRGIVFGQGSCEIEAGGDASIGAIDQAKLVVRGDLKIANYIRHSHVAVGGKIEVTGKKGTIVGGEIAAYRGIQAPYIGNNMATLTKLMVGSNPFISSELAVLHGRLDELEARLAQVNTALNAVHEKRMRTPGLEAATQVMLDRLMLSKDALVPEIAALTEQLTTLQTQATEYKEAKIRISDIVYPGVVINFRDRLQYKTMDEAQRLCFYEEAAEIRTGPY